MLDEDKNFGGSLVFDFRKWWRHMQAKNYGVLANHDSDDNDTLQAEPFLTVHMLYFHVIKDKSKREKGVLLARCGDESGPKQRV